MKDEKIHPHQDLIDKMAEEIRAKTDDAVLLGFPINTSNVNQMLVFAKGLGEREERERPPKPWSEIL